MQRYLIFIMSSPTISRLIFSMLSTMSTHLICYHQRLLYSNEPTITSMMLSYLSWMIFNHLPTSSTLTILCMIGRTNSTWCDIIKITSQAWRILYTNTSTRSAVPNLRNQCTHDRSWKVEAREYDGLPYTLKVDHFSITNGIFMRLRSKRANSNDITQDLKKFCLNDNNEWERLRLTRLIYRECPLLLKKKTVLENEKNY